MSLFGLPSLPKISAKSILNTVLSRVGATLWQLFSNEPIWGIYQAGSSAILAVQKDSVLEMSVMEESNVPDYRVQTGGFATYNKIAQPFEIPIRITKGGNPAERNMLITFLKTSVKQATVYDILMPECVWHNVTLTRYQIERTREKTGDDLIIADCWFKEIREAPSEYYNPQQGKADTTNTDDPDAVPAEMEKRTETTPASTNENINNVFKIENRSNTASNSTDAVKQLTANVDEATKKHQL